MAPHGRALHAYFTGEFAAQLIVRRDDGVEDSLPVRHFFRPPSEFTAIELAALERCRGRVLDIGAGTGMHSLHLQSQGLTVTGIDISPQAVSIMAQRGVVDVQCVDIFQFHDGPYDTMLLLGHGIGMVENLSGLKRFLAHAQGLLSEDGQLLVHSVDVRHTNDPRHLAYHEANRRRRRYIGEIRVQFEYEGESGPYCGWLHVDPQMLQRQAERGGWRSEIIVEGEGGEYLAGLARLAAGRRPI